LGDCNALAASPFKALVRYGGEDKLQIGSLSQSIVYAVPDLNASVSFTFNFISTASLSASFALEKQRSTYAFNAGGQLPTAGIFASE